MALSIGTVASGNVSNASSITFSLTLGATENFLTVAVASNRNGFAINSVTFAGVSMTKAVSDISSGTAGQTSIWTLENPTTGSSQNVVVTYAGAEDIAATATGWIGADTVNAAGATAHTNGISTSITTASANSYIVNVCVVYNNADNNAPTAANGETIQGDPNISSNKWYPVSTLSTPSTGSHTTGYNTSAQNSNANSISVLEIKPAALTTISNLIIQINQAVKRAAYY